MGKEWVFKKYEQAAMRYVLLYEEGRITFDEMTAWTEELADNILERFGEE